MKEVVLNLSSSIFIIVLGIILQHLQVFSRQDAFVLSRVILAITLPAVVLSNANDLVLDRTAGILILTGILANVFMLGLGYWLARDREPMIRGTYMLSLASYNLRNFVMPFVVALYPGQGVIYLALFDIGSSMMALGVNVLLAERVIQGPSKFDLKSVLRKFLSSVSIVVYLLMIIAALGNWTFPEPIIYTAQRIGQANVFLPLFMIGLLVNFDLSQEETTDTFKVLIYRFLANLVLVGLVLYFLPLPQLAKRIVVLALMAPMASASPAYAHQLGFDGSFPANAASLGIFSSLAIIIGTVLFLPIN